VIKVTSTVVMTENVVEKMQMSELTSSSAILKVRKLAQWSSIVSLVCGMPVIFVRVHWDAHLGLATSNGSCTDPAAPPPPGSSGSPYGNKKKCPTLTSQNSGAAAVAVGRFTILLVVLLLVL